MEINKVKIDKSFFVKRFLPVIAGSILGYAYFYFVGCRTGTCPISSNPFVSTIYGAVLGAIVSFPSNKKNSSPVN
jgi:hypothetical protein